MVKRNIFLDYGELIAKQEFNRDTLYRAHNLALDYLNSNHPNLVSLDNLAGSHNQVILRYLEARKDGTEWSMERIISQVIGALNISDSHVSSLVNIYKLNDHDYSLLPDAREVLLEIARSRKLGIISNLPHNSLIHELEDFELLDLFDTLTISGVVGYRKPHPAIYQSALAKAQTRPEESTFVSHDKDEVKGAERVGMEGILVKSIKEVVGML
ncbi:MAG: HAD family hydrolase [Nanoarchaeota archaeon]